MTKKSLILSMPNKTPREIVEELAKQGVTCTVKSVYQVRSMNRKRPEVNIVSRYSAKVGVSELVRDFAENLTQLVEQETRKKVTEAFKRVTG